MMNTAGSLWPEELLQGAVVVVIVPDLLTGQTVSASQPNSSSDLTLILPIIYNLLGGPISFQTSDQSQLPPKINVCFTFFLLNKFQKRKVQIYIYEMNCTLPSLVTLTGKYKEHHADYETGIFCYRVKCGERYHKHDNCYHKQITNSTLTQYNVDNVDTISFLKKNTIELNENQIDTQMVSINFLGFYSSLGKIMLESRLFGFCYYYVMFLPQNIQFVIVI